MRGHVRKRGRKWAVVVDIGRDETGKRQQKWHSGYATRREAEHALPELLRSINRGEYVPPTAQTVEGFLTEWLEAIKASVRPQTWDSYDSHVRAHIAPRLGSKRLQQLTTAHVNAMYADLLREGRKSRAGHPPQGLAPRSVRRIHAVLHRALGDAAKWGVVSRNVAAIAELPTISGLPNRAAAVWSARQLGAFLSAKGHRLYPLYALAATTGMRRGELLGLRWSDLDLDALRLSISQTLTADGAFSTPKTARGRRAVALDKATVKVLREHRAKQLQERLAWGAGYAEHDLVFARADGRPLSPRWVSQQFRKAVADAALPIIRFHDLRHTHATLALRAGVHPKVVSERLGHASVSITLDIYSHAIPAMQAEAAEQVAAVVWGSLQ